MFGNAIDTADWETRWDSSDLETIDAEGTVESRWGAVNGDAGQLICERLCPKNGELVLRFPIEAGDAVAVVHWEFEASVEWEDLDGSPRRASIELAMEGSKASTGQLAAAVTPSDPLGMAHGWIVSDDTGSPAWIALSGLDGSATVEWEGDTIVFNGGRAVEIDVEGCAEVGDCPISLAAVLQNEWIVARRGQAATLEVVGASLELDDHTSLVAPVDVASRSRSLSEGSGPAIGALVDASFVAPGGAVPLGASVSVVHTGNVAFFTEPGKPPGAASDAAGGTRFKAVPVQCTDGTCRVSTQIPMAIIAETDNPTAAMDRPVHATTAHERRVGRKSLLTIASTSKVVMSQCHAGKPRTAGGSGRFSGC